MATITDRYSLGYDGRVYVVDIDGTYVTVTVTAKYSAVHSWLETVLYDLRYFTYRNRLVVGLGVQWTPGGSDSPADTLQLCIGRRCLIFQLAHADGVPLNLRQLLVNPNHTFVGFWNHSDRWRLASSHHRLQMCVDPLDLRHYMTTEDGYSLSQASVNEIVEEYLGFQANQRKEVARSDWDYKYLTEDQVVYACFDAYCAFEIGRDIQAWNIER